MVTINRLKEVVKRIDANNIGLEVRVKDIGMITPLELNYNIYNKELLEIIIALKE